MINYSDPSKKIIIYGVGISGISTAKYLASALNKKIIISDDNLQNLELVRQKFDDFNYKQNLSFKKSEDLIFDENTIIICSPGIKINNPPHPILTKALKSNTNIICDIEFFYHINQKQNFIAITGTNGKSTTSALIYHILQELGINSQLGGNIGVPCFDLKQDNSQDINYVLEVSSYQIDLLKQTKFNIASLTNITKDHLDRYLKFENYIKSKNRIFNNQTENDFSIINIDDKICEKLYQKLVEERNNNIIAISTNPKNKNLKIPYILINRNQINFNFKSFNFKDKINSEYIFGKHNMENIAFACASVLCLIMSKKYFEIDQKLIEKITKAVEKFKGLDHRLQLIGKIDNISFYNDSKATNATSTSIALESCKNIYWIVGGRAKTDGITPLAPLFKKIVKAYLIGESSYEFAKILKKHGVNFEICNILESATKKAFKDAKKSRLSQKTILLSPACASFDQWQNFEQRGNFFCKIFNEIKKG